MYDVHHNLVVEFTANNMDRIS